MGKWKTIDFTGILKVYRSNRYFRGVLQMLFFGGLSLLLGLLRFNIPGFEGGVTDLREVAVLLAVLFLPHWGYFLGVALITSITTPADGSMLSTFIFQFFGMLFAWIVYRRWLTGIRNFIYQGLGWAGMVVAAYVLVILPIMAFTYWMFGLTTEADPFQSYIGLVVAVSFEIFVTASITSLLYVSRNMRIRLRESNKELKKAKERAEESDAIKTAFLQNISHEVRTPMNVLKASSDLILEGKLNVSEKEELKKTLDETTVYLINLLDQIIEFSRVEAGASMIKLQTIKVRSILNQSERQIRDSRKLLLKDHLELSVEADEGAGELVIFTDPDLLSMIISHLAENALKFTNSGYVKVKARSVNNNTLIIEVEDSGPGIPEDFQERIFDRFFQVDPFTRGVGLSLSLARKMAGMLGASLSVKSIPGKGSVFSVQLPLK